MPAVFGMTAEESQRVADLFADELARGWIPRLEDVEAALAVVRAIRMESEAAPTRAG